MRGPAFGTGGLVPRGVPARQTRSMRFDDVALRVMRAVVARWADRVGDVDLAVEEVPVIPSGWSERTVPLASYVDRTPTSHVFAREGDYTIRLVIDFAAEYRFAGSPFYPISGVIPLRANDLRITVDDATTVLVERDCAANPAGPGC